MKSPPTLVVRANSSEWYYQRQDESAIPYRRTIAVPLWQPVGVFNDIAPSGNDVNLNPKISRKAWNLWDVFYFPALCDGAFGKEGIYLGNHGTDPFVAIDCLRWARSNISDRRSNWFHYVLTETVFEILFGLFSKRRSFENDFFRILFKSNAGSETVIIEQQCFMLPRYLIWCLLLCLSLPRSGDCNTWHRESIK